MTTTAIMEYYAINADTLVRNSVFDDAPARPYFVYKHAETPFLYYSSINDLFDYEKQKTENQVGRPYEFSKTAKIPTEIKVDLAKKEVSYNIDGASGTAKICGMIGELDCDFSKINPVFITMVRDIVAMDRYVIAIDSDKRVAVDVKDGDFTFPFTKIKNFYYDRKITDADVLSSEQIGNVNIIRIKSRHSGTAHIRLRKIFEQQCLSKASYKVLAPVSIRSMLLLLI